MKVNRKVSDMGLMFKALAFNGFSYKNAITKGWYGVSIIHWGTVFFSFPAHRKERNLTKTI